MLVRELIEKLKGVDQDAKVLVAGGYDHEYGQLWSDAPVIEMIPVGWDDEKQKQIMEVYIL